MIEKDFLYQNILNLDDIEEIGENLGSLNFFMHDNKKLFNLNPFMLTEALEILYDEGIKIVDYLVQNELKRGDSPTKYSKAIYRIKRIEGIDYLVQILQALGKETLDRNSFYHNFSYYWSGTDKKREVLSHLLKVCHPSEKDNSKELAKKLKGTDITEQRLIEVAMFSSQWIEIIEGYLGWKGLASGCY